MCCIIISVICSFWFSRKITVPIKHIGTMTEQMSRMKKDAVCNISSEDEIGALADNINHLYRSLLSAIQNLEIEKQNVSEIEKSKVDFLRAASHELKTPVTALNSTLENMILGVGKYKVSFIVPKCIVSGYIEIVAVGENGKYNKLHIKTAKEVLNCCNVSSNGVIISFSEMKANEKTAIEFSLVDSRDYAMEVNVYEHN